jgi:Pentapeptide repeats (8 copies)
LATKKLLGSDSTRKEYWIDRTMGIEPRDLGALEKAVNDAAGRASNLWISFVLFATLIAITTGTVTHKHLFLELPLKLPVLNVDLPLMGYFFAVPLFFVVFHFYMLLQLDGLAAKVEDYNAVLREQNPHAADRRLLRQRLDSFIFAQVLVGARDRREGRIGRLNRAVAWLTMVALPIGTLLLLQLMFLPYHHQGVTWWHRACVLADLALVWFFWGRLRGAHSEAPAAEQGPPRTVAGSLAAFHAIRVPPALARIAAWSSTVMRWAIARSAVAAGAAVVLFATLVAVYPTERMHAAWFRAPLQPLTRLLLEGDVGLEFLVQRKPWLASNRLMLADTDLGVEEKLVALAKVREALDPGIKDKTADQARSAPRKVTLSLWDRDLSYANLLRADLRQVDLSRANMRGATLIQAQLQGTNLRLAQLQSADLVAAQLQGANLRWAQLQGALLSWAQLQGADLSWAQLQGADLSWAQLQGANLRLANVYRTVCPVPPPDVSAWRCLQAAGASVADVLHFDLRGPLDDKMERKRILEADDPFSKFVEGILLEVPTDTKVRVRGSLSVLEPGARTPDQDARQRHQWKQERLRSLSPSRRAHIIARLACAAAGAPHVARGLLRNDRLRDTRHYLHDIAAHMQKAKTDAAACPGVNGFLDADWQQLGELVKAAPPKPDAAPSNPRK